MPKPAELDLVSTGPRAITQPVPALSLVFIGLLGSNTGVSDHHREQRDLEVWADIITVQLRPTKLTAFKECPTTEPSLRNQRLATLIEGWLQDESRDDERIAPLLDRVLTENPPRFGA